MECKIPYHYGLKLGQSLDMKKLEMGPLLINEEMKKSFKTADQRTSEFAVISALKDVCDILNISPEYAIKVTTGIIRDETVSACLNEIGLKDHFTIVFKTSYLQEQKFIDGDINNSCCYGGDSNDTTQENLINDAAAINLASATSIQHHGTHWVKTLDFGDELICILTISCKDQEKLSEMWFKILNGLRSPAGSLDGHKLKHLHQVAKAIDKKLKKSHYTDVKLVVRYCYFKELSKYPASFTGMVKQLIPF